MIRLVPAFKLKTKYLLDTRNLCASKDSANSQGSNFQVVASQKPNKVYALEAVVSYGGILIVT